MEPKPQHPLLKTYSFNSPTRLVFGTNSLERLKDELKPYASNKAMLITGASVSRAPVYKRVMEMLPAQTILEFKGIPPEPEAAALTVLSEEISREKPDIIIGLGGGSTMDMAKLASLIAGNPKNPLPFFRGEPIAKRGPPIITIPTIAGTGSEVTPISVVTEKGIKLVLNHPFLCPAMSIIDPMLSLTAPPSSTASAGIDALNHAVESIMSLESNPVTASLAFEAINLADNYLERAFTNGEDLEARNGLALASAMAGMAFANTGLCITHGIAYTYAVRCGLAHGVSVALAEPYVVEFNAPAMPEKLEVIAAGLGVGTEGLSVSDVREAVAMRYIEIMGTLGLPMSLEDLGLGEDDVELLVDDFLKNYSRFITRNPRHPSRQELLALYKTIFEGY
jgi:alcohol dehydrogenase class IV